MLETLGSDRRPCSSSTNVGDAKTGGHKFTMKRMHLISFATSLLLRGAGSSFFVGFKAPTMNKTAQETKKCLQQFVPPDHQPDIFHTDFSLEFLRAGEDLFPKMQSVQLKR